MAARLLEEGNSACKIDPFMPTYPIPRDISLPEIEHATKIFESIRNAVGQQVGSSASARTGSLTTYSAIRVAKILEPYHPFWFEEPGGPLNIDEMARVAAHTSIPIASGERLVTKYEFSQLIEKKAAQIIQLDVGQCGGILEAKKIAAIAEAHYAMIAPHMYCGPIAAAAAAVQIDTCSPNFLIQEANQGPPPQNHLQRADSIRERSNHPAHRSGSRHRTRRSRTKNPPHRVTQQISATKTLPRPSPVIPAKEYHPCESRGRNPEIGDDSTIVTPPMQFSPPKR